MLFLAIFVPIYSTNLQRYAMNSWYWWGLAAQELVFWFMAFYPRFSWSKLKKSEKLLIVPVTLRFCLYFLPPDILLSPPFLLTGRILTYSMGAVVINELINGDDDDDDDGNKKLENKPHKKKKFSFIPQSP
jgi:hypothetical protein